MPNHTRKLSRAHRLSATGRYPGTYDATASYLPPSAVARLPAWALGELIDAIANACRDAKALTARDIVAEGAVYDIAAGRLRELAT